MHLQKCENGHFYDADKFTVCPHCSDVGGNKNTVPAEAVSGMGSEYDVTTPLHGTMEYDDIPSSKPISGIGKASNFDPGFQPGGGNTVPSNSDVWQTVPAEEDDDGVTQAFFSTVAGTEPVVGWLVCVQGPAYGESFSLKTGKNFIGRQSGNDIVLDADPSVSRVKHAIIVFEPKKRMFIAQPGESSHLFYVDDEVVLSAVALKPRAVISIGDSKLIFVPFCDESIGWDDFKKE